ncbi:MAG: type II secretion system protein [Tissierellia bacterium]|nr:type II secretion system protein [Tissierellia bacterium]
MKNNRGFTLIEAVVGLSILGIVVIYMLPVIYNTAGNIKDNQSEIILANQAQMIMENYKSNYFTGEIVEMNLQEDLNYEITEEDKGELIMVSVRVYNESKEFKLELSLPKEKGLYTP